MFIANLSKLIQSRLVVCLMLRQDYALRIVLTALRVVHYNTDLKKEPLMTLEQVKIAAKRAKEKGAGRFCIAAAWRSPPKKDFIDILEMVSAIKAMDLEACATLGMLSKEQAIQLAEVGLDYYNHNLDTSPEYYATIISTRTYQERLETLACVRAAGIKASESLFSRKILAILSPKLVRITRLKVGPDSSCVRHALAHSRLRAVASTMTLRRDAFPASPVNARLSWALRLALLLQCSPVSSFVVEALLEWVRLERIAQGYYNNSLICPSTPEVLL
jgi:hypothetical protein